MDAKFAASISASMWRSPNKGAALSCNRAARRATPRCRADGATQYPNSALPSTTLTWWNPAEPMRASVAASAMTYGKRSRVAYDGCALSTYASACSRRYGAGTTVQRTTSGSWQANVMASISSGPGRRSVTTPSVSRGSVAGHSRLSDIADPFRRTTDAPDPLTERTRCAGLRHRANPGKMGA